MSAVSSGVLYVHSAPRALSPQIEWAVSAVLGHSIEVDWAPQPVLLGTQRTEYCWSGPAGSAAVIASALHGFDEVRYEVTEDAAPGIDGGRWCHTPALGIFHAPIDAAGNMLMTENRLRAILEFAGDDAELLHMGITRSLGDAWDAELEVFRNAPEAAPVRWLHRTG